MSLGDGQSLTGREQAILDGLAAKAAADDPVLAAALQGRQRSFSVRVPPMPTWLAHWSAGVVMAVVGWALTVVGLSTSILVGVLGAGLAFTGVGRVLVAAPWIPGRKPPAPAPLRIDD